MSAKRQLRVVAEKTEQLLRTKFDEAQAAKLRWEPSSCKEGCNHCCKQYVACTPPEAMWIVNRYPEVVRRVRRALKEQEAIELECVEEGVANQGNAPTPLGPISSAYWARQRVCAFLDGRGRCSIYAARPLGCRAHVVSNDPAECASLDVEAIVRPVRMPNLEADLYDEMSTWLDKPGRTPELQLLPLAANVIMIYRIAGGKL